MHSKQGARFTDVLYQDKHSLTLFFFNCSCYDMSEGQEGFSLNDDYMTLKRVKGRQKFLFPDDGKVLQMYFYEITEVLNCRYFSQCKVYKKCLKLINIMPYILKLILTSDGFVFQYNNHRHYHHHCHNKHNPGVAPLRWSDTRLLIGTTLGFCSIAA